MCKEYHSNEQKALPNHLSEICHLRDQVLAKICVKVSKRYEICVQRTWLAIKKRFILISWGAFDNSIWILSKTLILCHVRDTLRNTNFNLNPVTFSRNWPHAAFNLWDDLSIDLIVQSKYIWGINYRQKAQLLVIFWLWNFPFSLVLPKSK